MATGSDDDPEIHARWPEEFTPPAHDFGHRGKSALEVEFEMCKATCERQRLALSAMQARHDILLAALKESQSDRRILASRLRSLEAQIARLSPSK